MPDDRLFHKRLGHSEKVTSLSDFEVLVWWAYIMSADDFGVMRQTAHTIQADSDRMATKPAALIQKALVRLVKIGLTRTFEHQARVYCYQHDWQDWQRIDYPRTTVNPAPQTVGLSEATVKLFAKHPGGWGRKKDKPPFAEPSPNGSPNGSTNVRQTFDGRSGEISREPLAVSRSPVATSRTPVPATTAPSANARSKWPVFKGQRLVVFDWMLEDLRRLLGKHVEGFKLDEWLSTLDERIERDGLVLPQRDSGAWLQAQTLEEAERRGLAVARPSKAHPLSASMYQPGTSAEELAEGVRQDLASGKLR